MTKIIVASTGTGKTTAANTRRWNVVDSDSDQFRWIGKRKDEIENPSWPQNYIDHVATEYSRRKFDAVLLSAYILLLPTIAAQVPLTFVYPSFDQKDAYEVRYRERGNPPGLVTLLVENFDGWVTSLMAMEGRHVVLKPGLYLQAD